MISDRTDMTEETKRSEIVRVVTNLAMASMMIAVSAGQLRQFRTKVESAVGRKLAGVGDEVVMALAMLDESTLRTLAPITDTKELVKLAGVLREEPALINVLKTEKRLPTLPATMRANGAAGVFVALGLAATRRRCVGSRRSRALASAISARVSPSSALPVARLPDAVFALRDLARTADFLAGRFACIMPASHVVSQRSGLVSFGGAEIGPR